MGGVPGLSSDERDESENSEDSVEVGEKGDEAVDDWEGVNVGV